MFAVVIVIKKLRRFVFGRKFTVFTDHKPLVTLLKKDIIESKRLENLVWKLEDYEFEIHHIPGKENYIADAGSRMIAAMFVKKDER